MKNIILYLLLSAVLLGNDYNPYISRLKLTPAQDTKVKPILIEALNHKELQIKKIKKTKGFFNKFPIMKETAIYDKKILNNLKDKLTPFQLEEWKIIQDEIKKETKKES